MAQIGIIGLGNIGRMHALALGDLPEARLVAYSGGGAGDPATAGASQLSPAGVIGHPDIDVVAICTPSQTHAELALAALDAGKHVLVEKPLALSVGDAVRIADRARATGRVVSMVAQRRLEPEHRHLKQALDSGALGALRLAIAEVHWWRDDAYYAAAGWRSSMAGGGGSLMNQGVHSVDLIRWLCGEVIEVTAQYGTVGHRFDAEDTTVATLRFASGALGLLSTTTATPPGHPATLGLYCAEGTVELGQGEVLRWEVPVPPPGPAEGPASGASDPLAIGRTGHLQQWRDVLEAIRDGTEPAVGVDDAVATVRLLCAIYAAAETGRAVRPGELT